jgi:phytoene dehydrogenase-like protein
VTARSIVIGGGVDELVAAHQLARAGHDLVVVAAPRPVETATLQVGWIPPNVLRDPALHAELRIDTADPWAVAALSASERLELFKDTRRSTDAIRRLSPRDAQKWPDFCRRMHALAGMLATLYAEPPPDPFARAPGEFWHLARVALRMRGLHKQGIEDLLRLMPMSIADLLDEWFESDALKGILGAAGVMHLCQGPRSGGTAFNFLHHHVGSAAGIFRQPLSNIHRVLSAPRGVQIRDVDVAQIRVDGGRVRGVVLANGEEIGASLVVCGMHPRRTLLELIDPVLLDPQFVRAVQRIRSRGVVAEVTLTIDGDPGFSTLSIAPSLDYLERAYDHAKYGRISTEPFIEARYEKVHASERGQVRIHAQYAPHALDGAGWDTVQCDKLARTVVDRLSEHVPRLKSAVLEQHVLAPPDLEALCGFPEGQRYHAELALDQALWMRPVPELARYRTPVHGLYLCGPAMHPGGGIPGAAGANAARIIMSHSRKQERNE